MCGRTSLFIPQDELEGRFDARVVTDGGYQPRFNIAPGDPLAVITNETPDKINQYTWGLVPQWADDPGNGLINARSETADEKPSFRDAWDKRPCLVLSSGFYEWQQSNSGPKQPYRIYRDDDAAFAMAGLLSEPAERTELCRPYPDDDLDAYPISTTVNNPSNDDARVIEPLGNEQAGLDEFA